MPAWAPLSIRGPVRTPGTIMSGHTAGRAPPYAARRTGPGYNISTGSMPGEMLMWARKTVTCLWRFLAHANRALTCEGDVAVNPMEPEGDVGDAGEISEGDVGGDVELDNGQATPAPIC